MKNGNYTDNSYTQGIEAGIYGMVGPGRRTSVSPVYTQSIPSIGIRNIKLSKRNYIGERAR